MPTFQSMPRRFKAAAIHLTFSAVVGAATAALVFGVWYPPPFGAMTGGIGIFLLLVSVDVVLGPVLTLVVASPGKSRRELTRDLSVIVFVQLVAFTYGAYSVAIARPVLLVFEVDRFRVIHGVDIEPASLAEAPEGLGSLSWTGPRTIAAVKPTDPREQLRSIDLASAGFDLSFVPKYWRPYESQAANAWRKARPLPALVERYPQQQAAAERVAREAGTSVGDLRFLPVVSRGATETAVLRAPDARIVGFLPVDGFL